MKLRDNFVVTISLHPSCEADNNQLTTTHYPPRGSVKRRQGNLQENICLVHNVTVCASKLQLVVTGAVSDNTKRYCVII